MNFELLRKAATDFRETWVKKEGYVVIFEGTVSGWISGLHSASDWRPGSIAVSTDGDIYQAQGGNDSDGALATPEERRVALDKVPELCRDITKTHVINHFAMRKFSKLRG